MLVDFDLSRKRNRFGTTGKFHGVSSLRQTQCLTVPTIYLRVKSEVRSQSLGLGRIDTSKAITDLKHPGGGFAFFIFNT